MAANGDGGFLLAWDSDGPFGDDTSSWSIQARLYDSSAAPLSGQFQVNSYTTSYL